VGKLISATVGAIGGMVSMISDLFGLDPPSVTTSKPYNDNLLTNAKAPTSYIGVVYGHRRKAGIRIGTFIRGESNQYLYAVYALSHGPIQSISNPIMDGVPLSDYDVANTADWSYGLGGNTQDATTDRLIIEIGAPDWDMVDGKLGGVAFAVVKLTIDPTKSTSLGNMTFDIQGRRVLNPTTGLVAWSNNPSWCLLDYLSSPIYGKGMPYPQSFNLPMYIDAANYFDEIVGGVIAPIAGGVWVNQLAKVLGYLGVLPQLFNKLVAGNEYTVTDAVSGTVYFSGLLISKSVLPVLPSRPGEELDPIYTDANFAKYQYKVHFNEIIGANLPTLNGTIATQFKFSRVLKRYTCNGNVDTSQTQYDNIQALSSSFNGFVTFLSGLSTIVVDRPEVTSLTLDSTNIVDDIIVKLPDSSTRLNKLSSTWFDPEREYDQVTLAIDNKTFLDRDAGRLQSKGVNLPFCNNPEQVERILTIELNKSRHFGAIQIKTLWAGLDLVSGNVIQIVDSDLGWGTLTPKLFRVVRVNIPSVFNDVELTCVPYDANDYIDSTINLRSGREYIEKALPGNFPAATNLTIDRVKTSGAWSVKASWVSSTVFYANKYTLQILQIFRDANNVITSYVEKYTYNNIYSNSYDVSGALSLGVEYEFRLYSYDKNGIKSLTYTSTSYTHIKLVPPTGIAVTLVSPWSIEATPVYLPSDVEQLVLDHKWYIAEHVDPINTQAPPFSSSSLVDTSKKLRWSGAIPEKTYLVWVSATTSFDDTNIAPGSLDVTNPQSPAWVIGAGQSFTLAKATSEDNGTTDIVTSIATTNNRVANTETLLANNNIDTATLVNLNATFQQLGVDLLSSQGDTNTTFNTMVNKLQDTDSFVASIDAKVGQLLVQGSQITFDTFSTYQFKVDTLEGSLSSVSTRVTNTEAGLVAANTAIQQNADQISLLAGTTSFSDLNTKLTQVSLKLDGLDNSVTQESFSANFAAWGDFQQTLKGEINVTDLIEKNIDFGFAQSKLKSDVTDVIATATAKDLLIANLNDKVSLAVTSKEVLSTVDFASSSIKTELRSETATANAALTESLTTLASDQLATANKTTILEATISDPNTGLAKSHSLITNEISVRSTETSTLATRATTLEANLFEADGLTPKFGAAIANNNIATIGYCSIDPTINSTEALCTLAGGSWVAAAPFASSFKKVNVTDNQGNVVNASQTLSTNIDRLGNLESNAVVELDVNGYVTGTRQSNNGIVGTMQVLADKFEIGTLSGATFNKYFYLDSTVTPPELVFVGRAEFGGYAVKSQSDIRALDGNTIYEEYQYSINNSFNWHSPMVTGDKYRRDRTVTISPTGTTYTVWTAGSLIAGVDGTNGLDGVNGSNGTNGVNGARGAGTYAIGTTTGVWGDTIAQSSTPGNTPVLGDVVTIYKITDQSVAGTKTFDGINWVTYAVRIHGNQLVDGSITSQQVNTNELFGTNATFKGSITLIGTTHMKLTSAIGFGSTNQFIEWFGLKYLIGNVVDMAQVTDANAIMFIKTNGDSSFKSPAINSPAITGGTLTLSSAGNTTLINQGGFAIWYGTTINSTSPTASNAIWFLENNGQYKKDVSRTKIATTVWNTLFALTPTPHYVIDGNVELTCTVGLSLRSYAIGAGTTFVSEDYKGSITIQANFKSGGVSIGTKSQVFYYSGTQSYSSVDNISESETNLNTFSTFTLDMAEIRYATKSYSVDVTITDTSGFTTNASVKNLEAKFTTLEIA